MAQKAVIHGVFALESPKAAGLDGRSAYHGAHKAHNLCTITVHTCE